jgi:hypothetical protein
MRVLLHALPFVLLAPARLAAEPVPGAFHEDPACPGASPAVVLEAGVFSTPEYTCTLSEPTAIRDMGDATLYDALCERGGAPFSMRLFLMTMGSGTLVQATSEGAATWHRCPDAPSTAKPDDPPSPIAAFPVRSLDSASAATLQAALSFEGCYRGLIDGELGPLSEAAIAEYMAALGTAGELTWHEAGGLASGWSTEIVRGGWAERRLLSDRYVLWVPESRLRIGTADGERLLDGADADGALRVSVEEQGFVRAMTRHNSIAFERPGITDLYQIDLLEERGYIVTSGVLPEGRRVYARSDRIDDRFVTLFAEASGMRVADLSVIAASVFVGADAGSGASGAPRSIGVIDGSPLDQARQMFEGVPAAVSEAAMPPPGFLCR